LRLNACTIGAALGVVLVLTVFWNGSASTETPVGSNTGADELLSENPHRDILEKSVNDLYRHFSREEIERGRQYRSTKYLIFFLRTGLTFLFLYLVIRVQAVQWLAGIFPVSLADSRWLAAGLYAVILTIAISLITLPINMYSGYFHEHSFGLSTRTLPSWFADVGKYMLMQVLITFITFAVLYLVMGFFPVRWWVVSAMLFSLFMIGMTALSPLVIDPLFNKFTTLEDEGLKQDIIELSKGAGVEVDKVYKMDASSRTRKLNAYFTGLGSTKRVVLYDTLLSKGDRAEILMVVAHELGHWKRGHLWKGLALATLGTFFVVYIISMVLSSSLAGGWGIASFDDPAGVPVVLLIVMLLGFLSMPVQNVISRHYEKQADMDSLVFTGDPDTFIKVEEKIGRINLNDVDPRPWLKWILFTHPPTMERIKMGEEFKRANTKDLHNRVIK